MYSVYTYISLDPQQEYNQDQTPLMNQGLVRPFLSSWDLQKYDAVSD